ncbi:extracellular solute-binding protein, partial [Thermus sp.]|uniref:extracellular solute-binding protein n=1 Tax=Thermus sp. TaxID=275 RepID=UPI0025D6E67E
QYWHINTEAFGLPALRELIREFERRNPGIKVEERYNPNAYTGLLQNLQAALAAGNPPDVGRWATSTPATPPRTCPTCP